ncbi:MAG: DUF4838 domain-containing protein [Verrucomicrobia bacterium]|nr:DUF4838 domain-containing protein [Verrucomicrobiota bacterium]
MNSIRKTVQLAGWVLGLLLFPQGAGSFAADTGTWTFEDGTWRSSLRQLSVEGDVALAQDGRALATIVLADKCRLPERTAALELAAYLHRITGASFRMIKESEAAPGTRSLYVGPTKFAQDHGITASALGAEEWIVRTVGGNLLLIGGNPRGTLYAVYQFLEDDLGVHWWNRWCESVPRRPALSLGPLNHRSHPAFGYRAVYSFYEADRKIRKYDEGRLAARNRLNSDGAYEIAPQYGGFISWGLPNFVHTFYLYIDPKVYFKDHPEWFALVQGKRRDQEAQLNLLNQEMRNLFLEKLRANIKRSRASATRTGTPPPIYFDISHNDSAGFDESEASQAMVRAEGGTEMAPVLDFVNYLADGIRDEFPDIFLTTLAYKETAQPPRTLQARDNVVITLCNTESSLTKSVTHSDNRAFRDLVIRWQQKAQHLNIWNYGVNYTYPVEPLPLPSAHTYALDYQFYTAKHVQGILTELGYPIIGDMRDLKLWMMMKLIEDPSQDDSVLLKTFTEGFYGPAGKHVREYLAALRAASEEKSAPLATFNPNLDAYRYLDFDFLVRANTIFDHAEAAVEAATRNPAAMLRVRQARMSLDWAIVRLYPRLMGEWLSRGHRPSELLPLDRDASARRYRNTWQAAIEQQVRPVHWAKEKAQADARVLPMLARKTEVALPEQFRECAGGTVFDYTAETMYAEPNTLRLVRDDLAEAGVSQRLEWSPSARRPIQDAKLPLCWRVFGLSEQLEKKGSAIRPEDIPGRGYHWYQLGTTVVRRRAMLSLFERDTLFIQTNYHDSFDPKRPDQEFDVWANLMFEGPAFPHGRKNEPNAISVARIILVKAQGDAKSN